MRKNDSKLAGRIFDLENLIDLGVFLIPRLHDIVLVVPPLSFFYVIDGMRRNP